MLRGFFVGQEVRRPFTGARRVVNCLVYVTTRRCLEEVIGECREPRVDVCSSDALKCLPDPVVQSHAPGGRQLAVERLADQRVDEAVSPDHTRHLCDDRCGDGFV